MESEKREQMMDDHAWYLIARSTDSPVQNHHTRFKAAEKKKRERIEMEKKMNARFAMVKAANSIDDPLRNLPFIQEIREK